MKLLRLLTIAAACFVMFHPPARAQTGVATVSWVAPTLHTDNTPIVAGEITGFRIDWSQCIGTAPNYAMGTVSGTASVGPTATSYTAATLTTTWTVPHCFVVTTLAKTMDNSQTPPALVENDSAPSVVVFKLTLPPVLPPAKPGAPGTVAIK